MHTPSNNIGDLRNLSNRDLLQTLLVQTENSDKVRKLFAERIMRAGVTSLYDFIQRDRDSGYRERKLPSEIMASVNAGRELPSAERIRGAKVYDLANLMLDCGYIGETLREQDKAGDYIYMAANNPNVEDELPEAGHAFWRAARFDFERWVARKKRGA